MRSIDEFDEQNRVIVEAMRSADPAVREEVRETLADMVDDEIMDEVLVLIRADGDPDYRGALAITLGPSLEICDQDLDEDGHFFDFGISMEPEALTENGYRRAVEGLEAVYRDASIPSLVRRRVLEAAVRSPQPWHEGAVRAAWGSGDEEWRVTAVFCMGFLYGDDFSVEVAEAMDSSSEEIVGEAMMAAGRRGLSDHAEKMMELAADPSQDEELRLSAVEALGELAPDGALEFLDDLAEERSIVGGIAEETADELRMWQEIEEDTDWEEEG